MIRYPIARADLEALIRAEKTDWIERARERTERFRESGRYRETRSIWSEVKAVYMRLQGNSKCAYCERKLESIDVGKSEQDVEHFRPKGNIKEWKPPSSLAHLHLSLTIPPAERVGYFLLPYNLFNYSAACKPCNEALKSDFFPIAGNYNLTSEDLRELKKEKPYLIYPIGTVDDDPAALIRFHGTSPQPIAARGHKRLRALVTIEFFSLDDLNRRKNLIRERVIIILLMYTYLEKLQAPANPLEESEAQTIIDRVTSPEAPHTNCARSFQALFRRDPIEAKSIFDNALRLLTSIS